MKRWWLFCFDAYYPCGGMSDFKGAFETRIEAEFAAIEYKTYCYRELTYIRDDGTPDKTIEL